jgi:Ca2+-binding EF-hand superfamily protein
MRRRAPVLVLAALAGCSTPAGPTGGAGETDEALIVPAFARADRNQDRVVSAEEWAAESAALFDQLDRNRDEAIDAVELRASFEVLDSDGDGAIEREEAVDLVERGDADGDGRLSPVEFEQLDWVRLSADLNRDGRITRDEFHAAREQLFLAADRNHDRRLGDREIDPVRFTVFRF